MDGMAWLFVLPSLVLLAGKVVATLNPVVMHQPNRNSHMPTPGPKQLVKVSSSTSVPPQVQEPKVASHVGGQRAVRKLGFPIDRSRGENEPDLVIRDVRCSFPKAFEASKSLD